MGLFFTARYSTVEHRLTTAEVRRIVIPAHIISLTQREEKIIQEAILARRRGDGKISLQQIYEVLLHLYREHTISLQDKGGVMKKITEYFETHFAGK